MLKHVSWNRNPSKHPALRNMASLFSRTEFDVFGNRFKLLQIRLRPRCSLPARISTSRCPTDPQRKVSLSESCLLPDLEILRSRFSHPMTRYLNRRSWNSTGKSETRSVLMRAALSVGYILSATHCWSHCRLEQFPSPPEPCVISFKKLRNS